MRGVAVLLLFAGGCGDGAPEIKPDPATCPVFGDFYAECGGTDSPRFACNATCDCRWFSGGVVAAVTRRRVVLPPICAATITGRSRTARSRPSSVIVSV